MTDKLKQEKCICINRNFLVIVYDYALYLAA